VTDQTNSGPSQQQPVPVEPKRILIIEDDLDITRALELRLKAAGFDVLTAADGEEGWKQVKNSKPDLLILDLMLPRIDGYNLCILVRKYFSTRNIPIIMLTAKDMITDVQKGLDLGANAYLTKPYNWDRLLFNIKKLLSADVSTSSSSTK